MNPRPRFTSNPLIQYLIGSALIGLLLMLAAGLKDSLFQSRKPATSVLQRFEDHIQNSSKAASSREIELSAWVTYNDEQYRVYQELVQEYYQRTGVRIRVSRIPFDGQRDKFLYAINSQSAPDIARMDIGLIPRFAAGQALLALDQFKSVQALQERLLPAALKSGMARTEEGEMKLFALPDEYVNIALFYNRDRFVEAGLNPDSPPKTWREFESMASRLTRDTNGDGRPDQFGFAMTNTLWWSLPFLYSFNGKILDPVQLECLLDSKSSVQGLEYQIQLSRDGVEGGAWRPGSVQPDTGFKNGRYAMILSGPWNLSNFRASGIDFGLTLVPGRPSHGVQSTTSIGGNSNVIFKSTAHPQEAFDFLHWMSSSEVQSRWSQELGSIPVNLPEMQANGFQTKDPDLAVFIEQAEYGRSRPGIPRYGKIETIVNQEVEAAFQGSLSPAEAYQRACELIDREILSELRSE